MTGKGYRNASHPWLRWAASALLLAAGWSAGSARAQTSSTPTVAEDRSPETRLLATAAAINNTPKPLPASVQKTGAAADKDVKTDPSVVPAGCKSCGGGLLGTGAPEDYEAGSCGCASCCIPGRLHCCSPCCSDTCIGKILCGLYECVCCPDPCYEPHWVAAANAAFFVDAARPVTQMSLRYDGMFDVQHPDRNEYLIPRSGASNNYNMLNLQRAFTPAGISFITGGTAGKATACAPLGFGKGANYVASTADIESLTLHVEGAIDKIGVFIDTPYREYGPTGSPADAVLGTTVCNSSGFGDIVVGTKTMWLDCELLQLSFQFKTFIPSGNFTANLGTAHVSLEPSLLFALKLGPDTYLQGQAAYWIPIAGDFLYEGDVFHSHCSLNHVLCRILPDVQLIGTLEANIWATNGGNFTSDNVAVINTTANPVTAASNQAVLPEGGSEFMFSAGPGIRLNICDRIDFGIGSAFSCTGPRWAKEEVIGEFRWRF